MSITNDQYILGQSISKELKELGEELRLDLQLELNPNLDAGSVYGTVNDSITEPIAGALVKIFSDEHEPLAHAISAEDGSYLFSDFPPGTDYHIAATAVGYNLEEGIPFTLLEKQNIEKNFTLQLDPNSKLGLIAGDINNIKTKLPINGAVVNLYKINADETETLLGVTFTNEYGQYTFRELEKENYKIKINSLGYTPFSTTITIDKDGEIAHVITKMTENPISARGTISGIITDKNNVAINDADVILYLVEEDESLTPISFTKTSEEGLYLFINVEEGKYKIKSNKTIDVTV